MDCVIWYFIYHFTKHRKYYFKSSMFTHEICQIKWWNSERKKQTNVWKFGIVFAYQYHQCMSRFMEPLQQRRCSEWKFTIKYTDKKHKYKRIEYEFVPYTFFYFHSFVFAFAFALNIKIIHQWSPISFSISMWFFIINMPFILYFDEYSIRYASSKWFPSIT